MQVCCCLCPMGKRLPGGTPEVSVSYGCVHVVFAVVADKILNLPRELKTAELASVLRMSWDLLLAANAELVPDLHAGRQISLGKAAP